PSPSPEERSDESGIISLHYCTLAPAVTQSSPFSVRLQSFRQRNAECALAEKFKRLVAVERMIQAGAHVSEEPLEWQPLEVGRSADRAQRQIHDRDGIFHGDHARGDGFARPALRIV